MVSFTPPYKPPPVPTEYAGWAPASAESKKYLTAVKNRTMIPALSGPWPCKQYPLSYPGSIISIIIISGVTSLLESRKSVLTAVLYYNCRRCQMANIQLLRNRYNKSRLKNPRKSIFGQTSILRYRRSEFATMRSYRFRHAISTDTSYQRVSCEPIYSGVP